MMLSPLCTILSSALAFRLSAAQTYTGPEDPRLQVEFTVENPTNGVSTTPDGRIFTVVARVDGSTGPAVLEFHPEDNTTTAYPNEGWNSYTEGKDPGTHFIGVNSQRIGPDGRLWIVDKGSPAFGAPVILPNGPKMVQIDVQTNEVIRVYPFGNASQSTTFLDDIRFNPASNKAYITDAGSPAGIIVLDLDTGMVVRTLNDHPSTVGTVPPSGEGSFLRLNGEATFINADHHEVSPDGQTYYFQPANGGMSKIPTACLDKAFYNSSLNTLDNLGQYVEPFAGTPSTGGTAIDANGNIYLSDSNSQRIIKIAPNGTMTTLVQDPRLLWVDAMWISADGKLWMPAAQLNRGIPFNGGQNLITKPLSVFSIDIGVGPSALDHA